MSVLSSLRMLAEGLFTRPATAMYPKRPRHYYNRTRGSIQNRIDECIFCGICARKCPTHALAVDRAQKEWAINRFDCLACGACVEACPKKCLDMLNTYAPSAGEKTTDRYYPSPEAIAAAEAEAAARAAKAKAAAQAKAAQQAPQPTAEPPHA